MSDPVSTNTTTLLSTRPANLSALAEAVEAILAEADTWPTAWRPAFDAAVSQVERIAEDLQPPDENNA